MSTNFVKHTFHKLFGQFSICLKKPVIEHIINLIKYIHMLQIHYLLFNPISHGLFYVR